MNGSVPNNIIFYPLLASEEVNGGAQTQQEFFSLWERFDQMTPDKQEILSSIELAEKIALLQKTFVFNDATTEAISVYLRWYYFDWLSQEELTSSIDEFVSDLEESIRVKVKQFVLNEILTLRAEDIMASRLKRESQEINQEQTRIGVIQSQKLQILKALSEYPNLGNQTISSERIRIKSQPEPVRGSLYNWIKYYRDELGIGQHSTVERGQFLFRSENGKALNALERERVNLILKSLEENLPLEIDTERQEIIFPPVAVETSSPLSASVAPAPLPNREPVVERVVPPAAPAPLPPVVEVPKSQAPVRLDAQPFVPKPVPSKPPEPVSMASKFQPSPSPYQKISIPPQPLSPERLASSNSGIDVSQMAEKLKREPKPEWIKGVFTKDSIPETTPIAPAVGSMSFSYNHALPAEQEKRQTPLPVVESIPEPREPQPQPQVQPVVVPQVQVAEKSVSPAPARGSSQFHIRPVSRRDS